MNIPLVEFIKFCHEQNLKTVQQMSQLVHWRHNYVFIEFIEIWGRSGELGGEYYFAVLTVASWPA